jgi:protein TonB
MSSRYTYVEPSDALRKPLMLSAAGHIVLAGIAAASALLKSTPNIWGDGSGGGAASVRLVSSASVPLPSPFVATQNRVATENKGMHFPEPPKQQEKPIPKPPPDPKAVDLPARNAKVVEPPKKAPEPAPKEEPAPKPAPREIASTSPRPAPRPTRRRAPEDLPQQGNEIPYGEGGPVTGPYGMIQSEAGTGGVSISGGGGDFGSRYSWYVTAIRNRISSNWLKATVDPAVRVAPRVYVTFQVMRDGRVVNPQLTQASGVASLDRSALRAVYESSPMPPLPGDYPGPNVLVEFWFDFRR